MNNFKATLLLLLYLTGISLNALTAQYENFDGNPDFVAGVDYKVINEADGYTVYWKGMPADDAQLNRSVAGEVTVYSPEGEERLIILVDKTGRFTEVIDLEYTSRNTHDQRKNKNENLETKGSNFDWDAPREVVFANGLRLHYANGIAGATYRGKELPVSGSKGRYRVMTDSFEAGIAFSPSYGKTVYHYFKDLQ